MNNIKVMVVDDSATVRQVLGDMLSQASGIEVIGTAGDPIFALRKMQQQWPDVVVLDVEMPRMDGLTFLKKLMAERPTPVVMCSTLTTEGSMTSLKALSLGAVEVVAKPQAQLREKLANSSRELVHAVRAAARANLKVLSVKSEAPVPRPKLTADAMLSRGPVSGAGGSGRLVAIGTSTGGTQALELVLSQLPSNLACPILAVQHMPEKFTAAFAKRLDSCCDLHIREAGDGDRAAAGQVLIAPGGSHMMLSGMQGPVANVAVKGGPLVSRHRPSVDVLFRSLAKINGRASMGIIMTGMGDDGAAGLKELRETGALTIGQDEATCVVYGMPAEAKKRGAVQREVPLQQIAREIIDYAGISANKLAAGQ